MDESAAYYEHYLSTTQLAVVKTHFGDGLFTKCDANTGEQVIEDAPLIAYPLPARHYAHYATKGKTNGFCFTCLRMFQEGEIPVLCSHHSQQCLHTYCSEQCRDRSWLNGHWLLCLDWNRPAYAYIQALYSEETYSDYVVAEIIAGLISKTMIMVINGRTYEDAIEHVFKPYKMLFGFTNPVIYKVNLPQKYKKIRSLFQMSTRKLNFIQDEIPIEILDLFVCPEIHSYVMSLIAFNAVAIQDRGIGIYSTLSKLNHSCEPNCNVKFDERCDAILEIEKPVQAGQELYISYIDDKMDRNQRRKELQEGWGFVCQCTKCQRGE
ncbi:SET_domain-containing protein [Hexamita inflata]|uniref:SET domain-containing protein n=1 Tax=Hexamita inflata TaxID=28002 RepID=A0AA86R4M4_9EUKA|nr:SET domain-containing protein [Hexamita inflata]